MCIKRYILMNYETAKYGGRANQAGQQGGESAEEIAIKSRGDQEHARRIRDIATAGVSVCTRGRKIREDVRGARREGSHDCEIACEYRKASSLLEEKKERKHQRNYNRGVEDLLKTKWDIKRISDKWCLSMSLIA